MSKINPFLNPLSFNVRQGATSEQSLYHDLAQEITEVAGIPIWYILRELVNYEGNAFFEDTMSEYRKAYPLTVYFENPKEGYDESNTIMAKLGVRFINYVTFQIPMMNFMRETKLARPREGDVICITAWKNHTDQSPATSGFPTTFFQVKDVAMDKKGYNNFGDVFWFTCKCEQWNYSNQTVETGNPDIDEMFGLMKNQTDSGRTKNDPIDDSEVISKLGNEIIDWSPDHPFGTEDDDYNPSIKPDEPGDIEIYDGNYSVVPARTEQILNTKNKKLIDDINVTEIPYYEVDNNDGGKTYIISKG